MSNLFSENSLSHKIELDACPVSALRPVTFVALRPAVGEALGPARFGNLLALGLPRGWWTWLNSRPACCPGCHPKDSQPWVLRQIRHLLRRVSILYRRRWLNLSLARDPLLRGEVAPPRSLHVGLRQDGLWSSATSIIGQVPADVLPADVLLAKPGLESCASDFPPSPNLVSCARVGNARLGAFPNTPQHGFFGGG